MSTEIMPAGPSLFEIMEAEDEKQIVNPEDFTGALVYSVQGKKELSYSAIKHLGFLMAQNGHALETIDSSIELMGVGDEKTWYATVKVRNVKTGQISEGLSECPFYDGQSRQDPFARTKAHSKAERNAIRKQIPEQYITQLINDSGTKVKKVGRGKVDRGEGRCDCETPTLSGITDNCVKCKRPVK